MTQQLNFFSLLDPTATILPFPPRRLLSLIEGAARRVYAAAPKDQPQAMLNEVGRLMLRYMLNGIDDGTAYEIAKAYEQAITAELYRLRYSVRRSDPGDAA